MFKCENCNKEFPTLLGKNSHKRTCLISDETLKNIKELYCEHGKSILEIWKHLNIPKQQIRFLIKKNNLKKKYIKYNHNDLNFAIAVTLNSLYRYDDVYNDWIDTLSSSPDIWNKKTLEELQNLVYNLVTAEISTTNY